MSSLKSSIEVMQSGSHLETDGRIIQTGLSYREAIFEGVSRGSVTIPRLEGGGNEGSWNPEGVNLERSSTLQLRGTDSSLAGSRARWINTGPYFTSDSLLEFLLG